MQQIFNKITSLPREHKLKLGFFIIIVIVALLSFGLGYMTAKDSIRTPIIIENY